MATQGNTILRGVEPRSVANRLDSLHAFELVAALWLHAVRHRLTGLALYVLHDELDAQMSTSLDNAQRLAARITQLGSAPTCSPMALLTIASVDDFTMPPDLSDPRDVVRWALAYQRQSIATCGALLDSIDGKDAVTAHLLLRILSDKVALEDELESALATELVEN